MAPRHHSIMLSCGSFLSQLCCSASGAKKDKKALLPSSSEKSGAPLAEPATSAGPGTAAEESGSRSGPSPALGAASNDSASKADASEANHLTETSESSRGGTDIFAESRDGAVGTINQNKEINTTFFKGQKRDGIRTTA
jgi:hypothetical protein